VGAWFLFFKAQALTATGEDYCANEEYLADAKEKYGAYVDAMGTAIRNHLMMQAMKDGKGPIMMQTSEAMAKIAEEMKAKLGEEEGAKKVKHLEAEAWEDFLDMCIGQAGLWAAQNVEPEKVNSEIMPTEPYLLGSHAGCAGFWVSGPEHLIKEMGAPEDWFWGYNRMSTVPGLFMMGDVVGASGHKFSSGSHAEGRLAAKAAIAYILDNPDMPDAGLNPDDVAAQLYFPFETYEQYKNQTSDPNVNPNYIRPKLMQARLQKIADEYFGGISTWYMTSKTMLEEGLKKLVMLKEDAAKMAAADLHELMRCWEQFHRILSVEAHARHILFREESRYPGYYYRGDFNKIDDDNWRCFVNSRYDNTTGEFQLFKREYKQLVD